MMALVHDLAEAQGEYICVLFHILKFSLTHPIILFQKVGDIAPREGISKTEKHRLETVSDLNLSPSLYPVELINRVLSNLYILFFSVGGNAQFCS